MKSTLLLLAIIVSISTNVFSHCQIPCGIYDDDRQFSALFEHAATIEKSISNINSVSAELNPNQRVRWIMNKESHATEIQDIINHYFLIQRIKPSADTYQELLTSAHLVLQSAMKTKQTSDLATVNALKASIDQFKQIYLTN